MPERPMCVRCILPATFPGISFDAKGECNFCQNALPLADLDAHRATLRQEMEQAIEAARGRAAYDCVVAFSGGKDSSYTLKLLVERYGLTCLAVTIDNGFMSEQARVNGATVTERLGVDLVVFRPAPAFMNHLYRQSATRRDIHSPAAIKRASDLCSSCIGLINRHMIRVAVSHRTPLIAGGYIGGQVPKDGALLRVDLDAPAFSDEAAGARAVRAFGPDAARFFEVGSSGPRGRVTIINPMLTLGVTEERIVEELHGLGWKRTDDTGQNSTNCRLNDLGILVHVRRYGFNPYAFEMAEQVRSGLLDRATALTRLAAVPDVTTVAQQARQIGLVPSDLA